MSLPASDVFTDTNGTNLGAHGTSWTVPKVAANLQVQSNAVVPNVAAASPYNNGVAYWSADTFSPDQYAECVVSWSGTPAGFIGPAVRVGANGEGYGVFYSTNNEQAQISALSDQGASGYTISTVAVDGVTWVSGDVMRLEVSGSTVTLKRNGTVTVSVTDTLFATGSAGLIAFGTDTLMSADSWQAGNLAGGGAPDSFTTIQFRP